MTEVDEKSFIEQLKKAIDDYNRMQAEYEHKQIIKLCEENDFIVPSVEIREKLEKILPKGTKIIVSRFTDCVLMVKKCVLNTYGEVIDCTEYREDEPDEN